MYHFLNIMVAGLETTFTVQGIYEVALCSSTDLQLRISFSGCSSEQLSGHAQSFSDHQDDSDFSRLSLTSLSLVLPLSFWQVLLVSHPAVRPH